MRFDPLPFLPPSNIVLGVIRAGVMQKLSEYYSAFLAGSGASLMEEFNIPAEHSMVSKDFDIMPMSRGGGGGGGGWIMHEERGVRVLLRWRGREGGAN